MPQLIGVNFNISDERLEHIPELQAELERVGLTQINILEAAGCGTGEIDPDKLDALRAIRGIYAIEQERILHTQKPNA